MKIKKYSKGKSNQYKVTIDDVDYTIYDDVIIKFGLLLKKDISASVLKDILKYNDELDSYYLSIKYITKKLRSEKEIYEYLKKKDISENVINDTIARLKENKFLDDELYLKAYINDQINLSNNGPRKIAKNLLTLGLDETYINNALSNIDASIWEEKIDKYVSKKVNTNHNSSVKMLKMKIINDLVNLGYDKEIIMPIINNYEIDDHEVYKHEYEKAKRQLEKKYEGYELERKIREKLYRKGFFYNKEDFYEE
ncbi:MAG: RecX family transcriptional regulator [Bacilli bacterium]|nr:RecX family transcriptional regulator [Bacilli bacterium]